MQINIVSIFIVVALSINSFGSQLKKEEPKSWREVAVENWRYIAGTVATVAAVVASAKVFASKKPVSSSQPRSSLPRLSNDHILPSLTRDRPQVPFTAPTPFAVLDGSMPILAPVAARAEERETVTTDEFLMIFTRDFNRLGNLAVLNARTYPHLISDGVRDVVLGRTLAIVHNPVVLGARHRAQAMATRFHATRNEMTQEHRETIVHQIRRDVEIGRGGVCTTFAFAAADTMLSEARLRDFRVEVVAHAHGGATHLFAVVQRAQDSRIEDPQTWGPNARIVDLWLQAITGNVDLAIFNVEQYRNMLAGGRLESIFDSANHRFPA